MKITVSQQKQAVGIAEEHGFKEIFINEKGEFFSNSSYAALSVSNDKEKWAKVDIGTGTATAAPGTNDLGPSKNVVAQIEASLDVAEIEAIANAEAEGKNRKPIINAASRRIESLSKNTQQ